MFKLQSAQLLWIILTLLEWPRKAEDLKLHKWEMEGGGFPVQSGPITKEHFLPPTSFFSYFQNKMPFSYSCQKHNEYHACQSQ